MKKLVFRVSIRCGVCGGDKRMRCMKCRGVLPTLAKPKGGRW